MDFVKETNTLEQITHMKLLDCTNNPEYLKKKLEDNQYFLIWRVPHTEKWFEKCIRFKNCVIIKQNLLNMEYLDYKRFRDYWT